MSGRNQERQDLLGERRKFAKCDIGSIVLEGNVIMGKVWAGQLTRLGVSVKHGI